MSKVDTWTINEDQCTYKAEVEMISCYLVNETLFALISYDTKSSGLLVTKMPLA